MFPDTTLTFCGMGPVIRGSDWRRDGGNVHGSSMASSPKPTGRTPRTPSSRLDAADAMTRVNFARDNDTLSDAAACGLSRSCFADSAFRIDVKWRNASRSLPRNLEAQTAGSWAYSASAASTGGRNALSSAASSAARTRARSLCTISSARSCSAPTRARPRAIKSVDHGRGSVNV
jgi:hypothetical protein